jgi:UDP-N-acetylglucosamine acyltransferase|tara:strand:+ start:10642 stop:11418 length:777 start_codon:yes stop_codon:yes gene_type:complete
MAFHPTSIIHDSAVIHESVEIGPFCYVGEDVQIGEGSILLSHVVLKGPTKIGTNNKFYQFSVIGEATPDKKFKGEKTTLEIGDNNIFREGVTIHRGTIQDKSTTIIGNDNLLMAYSHVAHDCILGDSNVFANHAGIAGHVIIGDFVTIGALTTIHQFCRIGDYSFVGMNTSITMDIPAYIKVAADPARVIGINTVGMSRNNISDDSITIIKKAYKLIYKKGYKLEDALRRVDRLEKPARPELQAFIDSINSSERGLLR